MLLAEERMDLAGGGGAPCLSCGDALEVFLPPLALLLWREPRGRLGAPVAPRALPAGTRAGAGGIAEAGAAPAAGARGERGPGEVGLDCTVGERGGVSVWPVALTLILPRQVGALQWHAWSDPKATNL